MTDPGLLPAAPGGAPPYDAGPILLGPSTAASNMVTVPSVAETEMGLLIALLIDLTKSLHEILEQTEGENRKLTRVLTRIHALERLTLIMATHNPNTPDTLLGRPDNKQTTGLWNRAKALDDAAHAKVKGLGKVPCARAIDDVLNESVKGAIQALSSFIQYPEQTVSTLLQNAPAYYQPSYAAIGGRSPTQIVQAYAAEDPPVPEAHQAGMDLFGTILARCHEELCKTEKMTDLAPLGRDAIENPGAKSLYHVAVKSAADVEAKFVQKVAGGSAAVAAGLIGPDGLSVALLKVYGLKGLSTGAVSKAEAKQFSGFLLRQVLEALRLPKAEEETLHQNYIRLANAQAKLVHAQNTENDLASRASVDLERLAAKQALRVAAEGDVAVEASRVQAFVKARGARFKGLQDGAAINGALTVFAACQMFDAWQEMAAPDANLVERIQNGTAFLAGGLQAGAGVAKISTVLGPKIPMETVRVYLKALNVDAFIEFASLAGPVLMIISGAFQMLDANSLMDREPIVLGGASLASGLCLYVAAALGGEQLGVLGASLLTGAGDLLAIGVGAYGLIQVARQALKEATQKLVEQLLASFDNDPSWTGKNYIDVLGLRSKLVDVKTASGSVDYFVIPWTDDDGSRAKLLQKLLEAGFDQATVEVICETDDQRYLRLNPVVVPAL